MKTVIVHPRTDLPFEALLPREVGEKWIQVPPLGGLYVRESARAAGFATDFLDAEILGLSPREAAKAVADGGYNVAGIDCNSYSLASSLAVAAAVREAAPRAFIVAGGIHPTIYPRETASLPEFDAAIAGEGEAAFPALLASLANDGPTEDIPGVFVKGGKGGRIAPHITDLDALPFPSTDGLPLHLYWSSLARSRPIMPLVTSRGCPFHCTFCDRPALDGRLRLRSADNVLREIENRLAGGLKEFTFYDDTLTAGKKRLFELCDALSRLPRKIRFDCRSRVDTFDPDIAAALARAGCDRVYFGVESGDPEVLKKIRKNTAPEQSRAAVRTARRAGIRTLGYFMLGLPGEDRDAARSTVELLLSLGCDFALIEVFIPMPKTEAYEEALSGGLIEKDYWLAQARRPDPKFVPPPWPGELRETVFEIAAKAYRRYYLSPSYLFRSLLSTRTFEELRQKVSGFFRFMGLR